MKKRILFLCTGNAARSQMAEALARLDWGHALDPASAGSRPTGWVHPMAIRAMEELGFAMESASSKSADEFRDEEFDVVVTVCDSAAQDCPTWPNARRIEHWAIEDPSFVPGDPSARYGRFLETRDELRLRIRQLTEDLLGEATAAEDEPARRAPSRTKQKASAETKPIPAPTRNDDGR